MSSLATIARNALQRRNLIVMADKIVSRFVNRADRSEEVFAWCRSHSENMAEFGRGVDDKLWDEATEFAAGLRRQGAAILGQTKFVYGTSGALELLYFLTRLKKPENIVETGVAAGWSSASILSALKQNGTGQLYSSDFPYFRQEGAADQIGILVQEDLRPRWHLYKDGDQFNLPKILEKVKSIDILHYDSDKSYRGRTRSLKLLEPFFAKNAVLLFDDVQDNFQFRDFVTKRKLAYRLFEVDGKYVGCVGI